MRDDLKNTEMGKVFFELDDTVDTKEKLTEFFEELGFDLFQKKPLGNELVNRVSEFNLGPMLSFDIIWYRNLAHIRFGSWDGAFIECDFTKIAGSYIPYVDHITLDLFNGNNRVAKVAVPRPKE